MTEKFLKKGVILRKVLNVLVEANLGRTGVSGTARFFIRVFISKEYVLFHAVYINFASVEPFFIFSRGKYPCFGAEPTTRV